VQQQCLPPATRLTPAGLGQPRSGLPLLGPRDAFGLLQYHGHHGTAGHLDGREPFSVQTIWFLSEFEQENGGTRILPDSSHWRRRPRAPLGHTLHPAPVEERERQSQSDEQLFADESIAAT
jgi:hypothetical protein